MGKFVTIIVILAIGYVVGVKCPQVAQMFGIA